MRIELRPARRRKLSLTSLIDVIFLLLLFFMLSSTFTRFGEVDLRAARAGGGSGERPDVLIALSEEGWKINGLSVEAENAIPALQKLVEAGASKAVLLVRAEMTSQQLVDAVETVRAAGGLELMVAR